MRGRYRNAVASGRNTRKIFWVGSLTRRYRVTVLTSTMAHLSFNVDRLNSANRIAKIKNRKTIFDSFQSCISKW